MHLLSISGLASAFLRHLLRVETLLVLASFALSLLGAVLTFYIRNDHGMRKTPVQCVRYLFPLHVLRLPSCKLDGLFVVAHWVTHVLLLGPLLVFNIAAAVGVDRLLVALFGAPSAVVDAPWVHPAIVAVALVLTDFGYYGAHALLHRYPLLWELHKVHHSAEYLIPISRRRLHPVEEVFDSAVVMLFVGSWLGVTAYVFGLPIQDVGIAGVDAYFVLNALAFYHLRHSHIPMSFGWLDRWLISPAQHHVHHSIAPEHLGRNLGTLFAFWDRMFGTWAPSVAYDDLTLGLLPEDQPQDYMSVPRLYWMPIRRTGERLFALLLSRAPQPVPSLNGDGAD
jgi:sterol desaturase/sphingolipid hydroxylase (fatty acid hydroxylase superfamily)